ncbi:MAG: tetratricopeptide repeat protein [Gemmatimonadaceae bacterium]
MTLPGEPDTLLSTARALATRGDWDGLRALLTEQREGVASRADLALLFAEARMRLGEPRAACDILLGLAPRFERSGDDASYRRVLNLLGAAHFELGELDAAQGAFAQALDLSSASGDDLVVARTTNNLGAIQNIRGRREEALAHYRLAVPAYQRLGNALGLAESFHNMAITFRDLRQLEDADEYERRAIEFARQEGNARLQAMAQVGRAELCLLRGDADLAHAEARRAARDYAAIPDTIGEADALRLAGAARAAAGDVDDALSALNSAVGLAREHGSALIEAEALRTRAEVMQFMRQIPEAQADARAALAIYTRLGAEVECEALRGVLEELAG